MVKNIFEDLELSNSSVVMEKSKVVASIQKLIEDHNLERREAAALIGITKEEFLNILMFSNCNNTAAELAKYLEDLEKGISNL